MRRRFPRVGEIVPLIGRPDRTKTGLQRRLERCATITDIREAARRRVPRSVFDYVDGGAGSETTLARSRAAYARVEFTPRVLRDVSSVDPGIQMLGQRSALPFALAPTGFTRLMHYVGEPAVARAAGAAGIPYALSTLGTTSPEALTAAVPQTRCWFQLYMTRDRADTLALMTRAADSGYDTLILTVDSAVGGIRAREVRNGMTIPPHLTLGTILDIARYPRWWINLLSTEPLRFATLAESGGTIGDLMTRVFDPGLTPSDVAWIRDRWPGHLMIKGIQCLADARTMAALGVDAVVLSNHGGRQVDMGNVPLELLPSVVEDLGDQLEVYVDGGILTGADIVAALAFGATGALVGRAYLYGLMAGGQDGVNRVVAILEKEIRTTMQLLGATSVADLSSDLVRLRAS